MSRKDKLKWYKREFENISNEIESSNSLTQLDFLRIRNFKLQNLTTENEENIKQITAKAFESAKKDQIILAIECLIKLDGVAIPIASTILAMKFPDKFAIIDRRVIKSLGKTEWLKEYLKNPEIYEQYLLHLRQVAADANKSLRDVERELFER